MKNIFKIMGLALMACTLTVACGDKNEDTTTVAEGINVTFDGSSWTGAQNNCTYNEGFNALFFGAQETAGQNFPAFAESFYATEAGSVTETSNATNGNFAAEATHGYVEYYKDMSLVDNDQNYYGDWCAEQATTNIVAVDLTALTVSAEMNGTMFNAAQAFVPDYGQVGIAAADRAAYSATFGNISMTAK